MYKEYRVMSRTEAVVALYQNMAAQHKIVSGRFTYGQGLLLPLHQADISPSQILKVVEIENTDDVERPYLKRLLAKNLKFPLPHRVARINSESKLFAAY